ncbi:beta-propeller fold lactonase family protein [Chiayiivirga flava]|uniref:Putative repeat protein (TIGR01451 family) n=1 Tax=Chiayiivirga flava TaxID=659595 RepID=A0A7W8D3C2_9GAMM|nr:putative repeat protein (TIGR01451 family) [Chiayiivirga flava]
MIKRSRRVRAISRALRGFVVLLGLFAGTQAQAASDLGDSTFTGPASYQPGQPASASYVLTLRNTGDDPTAAIPVAVTFPAGSTSAGSWSCVASAGGACGTGALGAASFSRTGVVVAAGGTVTFTASNVAWALAASGTPLTVGSSVTGIAPALSVSSTRIPAPDLSTSTFTGPATYQAGQPATGPYVLTLRNTGVDPTPATTVSVAFPAGAAASGSWSCATSSGANCGSGALTAPNFTRNNVTVPVGGSITLTASNIVWAFGATGSPLVVNASVTGLAPALSVSSTRVAASDVSIAMASAATTYTPGATGSFTFTVANAGPDGATGVGAAYTAPAGVTVSQWSCAGSGGATCPSSGSGNIAHASLALPAGGAAVYTVDVAYASSMVQTDNPPLPLEHLATVTVPTAANDIDGSDNSATVSLSILRQAALRVTKLVRVSEATPPAASATVSPGSYFSYEITVENLGPSDIGALNAEEGALLSDTFASGIVGSPPPQCASAATPCWSYCVGSATVDGDYGIDNCPVPLTSGTGSFANRAFKLTAGSSSTMVVNAAVAPSVTTAIGNTATVSLSPSLELVGTADTRTSTATVNVTVGTDVGVITDDGVLAAVPGVDHTYTVRVRNGGFIAANNVAVSGLLPVFAGATTAGFTAGTSSWQCSATGGACCNTNSSVCGVSAPTAPVIADGIDAHVDLPSGGEVVFTLRGRLDPRATGTLEFDVASSLPPGITDVNAANDADADADTLLVPQAGLTIAKSLLELDDTVTPNLLDYRVTVSNSGPSFAQVNVADPLDDVQLASADASWTCEPLAGPAGAGCPASGTGPLDADVDLAPGSQLRFDVRVPTVEFPTGEPIVNTATLDWNGVTQTASVTSGLGGDADLAIDKTDNRSSVTPGGSTEYSITVTNDGPDDVFGARVQDSFPPQLDNVSWTCRATTPVPGNLEFLALAGSAGTAGHAAVMSADGRHVYEIGSSENRVFVFNRNQVPGLGFGAVAQIETETDGINDVSDSGATVTGMRNPVDLVLSPDGAMLFVLSHAPASPPGAPSSIVAFNRVTNPADPAYGRLSFAGAVSAGLPVTPRRIVMTATHFYVSGGEQISIYRRDAVSGLPLFVLATDPPQTEGVPAAPGPMAISLADAMLFVASTTGGGVARFAINTTPGSTPLGRLSLVDSLVADVTPGITDLALPPSGKHLYIAVGGAGTLVLATWQGTLGVPSSDEVGRIVYSDTAFSGDVRLTVAPDGEHVLGSNRDADLLFTSRRNTSSGGLSGSGGTPVEERFGSGDNPALLAPSDVLVSGDGRHVLVASASGVTPAQQLLVFQRRAPDPLFAFVEDDRQGDAYGGGSQPPTIDSMLAPVDTVVSHDGAHVYVLSLQDESLTVFARNPNAGFTTDTAGGHLTFLASYSSSDAGFAGLARPSRLMLDAESKALFVSSEENHSVTWFRRVDDENDAAFGQLRAGSGQTQTFRDGVGGVDGLLGAQGIALSGDGRSVYVAGSFEASIGVFRRDAVTLQMTWDSVIRGSDVGVSGMAGIRDLQVLDGGAQVLGVGVTSNAVVVFNRNADSLSAAFGRLSFLQSLVLGGNERPMAIAMPPAVDSGDPGVGSIVHHVYIVGQNSNRIHVLQRVTDPTSLAYGTVRPLFQYNNAGAGFAKLVGPRDITVSPNGKRVYVAAQFSHSVLVLDRDLNRSSARFGALDPVEVRSDEADGVDGINAVYALAVSPDSRNVYAAGFGDGALASFAVGTGSSCSVSGAGDIDDLVDIGVGGTLVYTATASILPGATGTLSNTATVAPPERVDDPDTGNNSSTDTSTLEVSGDLSIEKTNDQVSVVGGQTVTYTLDVRNAGPSNVVNGPGHPVLVTDLFDAEGAPGCASGFEPQTALWTCIASGSGALDFVDARFGGDVGTGALGGVASVTLLADSDGAGPHPAYLAAASVLDNNVTLFARDPVDGTLTQALQIRHGAPLGGSAVDSLEGARSVVASADGKFLYVASRISDSVTVYAIHPPTGETAKLVEVKRGIVGLDQALHVALSPDGAHLYVAGANDDAIAVFARNATTGALTYLESEQNGVNDPDDAGNTVAGLADVEFTVVSPDGEHLYALSGSGATVIVFKRDTATGELSWRSARSGADLAVPLDGVSSGVFDSSGEFLYLTVANANRVVVLRRMIVPGGSFGNLALASSVVQDSAGTLGLLTPRRAALTADDRHLYVTGQGGASVAWFARDPSDGSLRYLGQRTNESSDIDGLAGATGIVVDDALNQVYVAGTLQGAVVQFRRQVDSFCPPSGSGPLDAVPVDIAAGGTLSFEITVRVRSDLACPLRNDASVQSNSDDNPGNDAASDVDVISSVADLSITKDDGLAEFDGLSGAVAIDGDADGFVVAAAQDNALGVFRRQADPGLPDFGRVRFANVVRSGVGGVAGLGGVSDVLLAHGGAHVYAVGQVDNAIVSFARGDGTLDPIDLDQNGVLGVAGMSGARAVAQSADGLHLYVASEFSNAIALFARDAEPASATFGALTYRSVVQNGVGGVDGILAPIDVIASPDGKHVYALGAGADSVALFTRNPNPGSSGFGQLGFVSRLLNDAGGVSGMGGVRALAFDASGTHLYVLAAGSGNLVHFTRDPGTGALTFAQAVSGSGVTGATRLRRSPDGAAIYVAGASADAIARFTVDAASGVPAFAGVVTLGDEAPLTGGQVLGLDGVADVIVSPDGEQLYAVSSIDNALATFVRDPAPQPDTSDLAYADVIFDGLGGVAPGDAVTYVIRVQNNGPSAVPSARVSDPFPSQFASVQWTCSGGGGGGCPPSGNGNIDEDGIALPVGGSVTFLATGVVSNTAGGRLVNTATVAALGVSDPDPSNNSATDGNTVLSPAMDLVATVDDGATVSIPGDRIDYNVRIANLGPTYASAVTLHDNVPPALYDVAWTCSPTPVPGVLDLFQSVLDSGATSTVQALALDPLGNHAYAAGTRDGAGTVIAYRRDPLNGGLTESRLYANGSDGVLGIGGAADLLLSGDARHLYVAGRSSDSIALFSRDAVTGELSFVTQYQDGELGIDGLGGVTALARSADGRHLYAAGALDDAIVVFGINAGNGALTTLGLVRQSQAGVDGLNGISDLALSADGLTVFAVARDNQSLAAFARNPATGLLAFADVIQNFELETDALLDPASMLVADGRVFVAAAGGDQVGIFEFDDNAFTFDASIENGVDGVSGLVQPRALVFDPDQKRLYVAGSGGLALFSLLGTEPVQLDAYLPVDAPVLTGAAALALSADARQLYTGANDVAGGIGVWARERGSRCPVSGPQALGGTQIDIAPDGHVDFAIGGEIFPNALGSLDYTVTAQTRVPEEELNAPDNTATDSNALQPNPDLSIDKTDNRSTVVAGTSVEYAVSVANAGLSDAIGAQLVDLVPVFPAATGGMLAGASAWTCDANVPLAFVDERSAASHPAIAGIGELAVTTDRARLYATNAATNSLLVFELDALGDLGTPLVIANGSTLGEATVSGLGGASNVAVSADGRHVLVTGASDNSLVVFARDPETGAHTFVQKLTSGSGAVAGLQGPAQVLLSADDTFVYVAAPAADSIAVFRRDALTGLLTFVERVRDGFGTIQPDSNVIRGVRRLHLARDGAQLYAVAPTSNAITTFDIDASSGRLTYRQVIRSGAVAAIAAVRDLVAAPGDGYLYALGSGGIAMFARGGDGRLAHVASTPHAADVAQPTALRLDTHGSRLYLADAGGAVHVYARDWASGAIEHRTRYAAPGSALAAPAALLVVPGLADLYATTPGAGGGIVQLDERALSRCLVGAAQDDTMQLAIDLGATGSADLAFAGTVHPSARGTLVNTASITPASGADPDTANNSATDSTDILVVSDLAIAKTAPADGVAGEPIAYTLQVSNAGPSDALGMRVADDLPSALLDASWTCVASGAATCPAGGNGDLDFAANLPVGETLEIVVQARIDPAFVGMLDNTALVVPEAGATDPSPADHSASAATQVIQVADVSVSKSNGVDSVIAGTTTQYVIDIANAGPSDAPLVRVLDPQAAALRDVAWTCAGSGGATCPASGLGGIAFDSYLPAGESLHIVVDARVRPSAIGTVVNRVDAQVTAPTVEPATANNSAIDTDAVLVHPDLTVALHDPLDPFDPDGVIDLPYVATVTNLGPSDARDVVLDLGFSANIRQTVEGPCALAFGSALRCDVGSVPAGASIDIPLAFRSLPDAPATLTIDGVVATSDDELVLGNNAATQATQLLNGGDLMVSIDDGERAVVPGEVLTYRIEIVNIGSEAVADAAIAMPQAAELVDATWTCTGGGCSAGSGGLVDTIDLASGGRAIYTWTATVDPTIDPSTPRQIVQTVAATVQPGGDINPDNNAAVDIDVIQFLIFSDGFEIDTADRFAVVRSLLKRACAPDAVDCGVLPGGGGR